MFRNRHEAGLRIERKHEEDKEHEKDSPAELYS